jgi:hypothetical protein
MTWASHVARIKMKINAYKICIENPESKRHLEYLGLNGRIILKWSLRM